MIITVVRTPFLIPRTDPFSVFNLPFAPHKDRPCFEQSLRGRGGYVPYDATSLWLFSSLQLRLLTSPQSSWILHRASSVRFLLRSCSGSGGTWATTWRCHMLWSFFFCCVSMERSVIDFDQANPVRVSFFLFIGAIFGHWSIPVLLLDSKWVEWISEMLIAIKILFLFLLVSGIQLGFWVSFRALCFPSVSIHAETSSEIAYI